MPMRRGGALYVLIRDLTTKSEGLSLTLYTSAFVLCGDTVTGAVVDAELLAP